jgi:hypothetical protein
MTKFSYPSAFNIRYSIFCGSLFLASDCYALTPQTYLRPEASSQKHEASDQQPAASGQKQVARNQ